MVKTDILSERTSIDRDAWNDIVSSANGHIFQTFHWSEVLQALGVETVPFMVEDKAVLMACKVPLLALGRLGLRFDILQVLRGPVFRRRSFDRSTFEELVSRLVLCARDQKMMALDLFPNLPASDSGSANYLLTHGFRPIHNRRAFHTQTYLLNCNQSDEQLLARMEERTRRSIRKAQRLGVTVRDGTDETLLDSFFEVYRSTNPSPQAKTFFETVNRVLGERGLDRIFISEVNGECAAATFALMFGGTVFYIWGGSSWEHRRYAPGALLHWETIRWGRSHGYRFYDFHGALVEDMDKYGVDKKRTSVTFFKKGFGGFFSKYMPQHELILSPIRYDLTSALRRAVSAIHQMP